MLDLRGGVAAALTFRSASKFSHTYALPRADKLSSRQSTKSRFVIARTVKFTKHFPAASSSK